MTALLADPITLADPVAPTAPVAPKDDPTIWRVDDTLWHSLAPLLVVHKPRAKPGRPRLDDRALFDGVLWVLRTGAQWAAVPREFGAKSTVHARFQTWVEMGAFATAWTLLLAEYDEWVGLDLRWQSADGCLVKAPLGKKGGLERPNVRAVTPPTGASAAPSATC
jgi:putative transposase